MSIQLPRNQKELHFTGSVKALSPAEARERREPLALATPLGRERPKAPPPLPPPSRAQASGVPDVYVVEAQPTPYYGARPSERAEAAMPAAPGKLTTMRGRLASFDDDLLTEALDRDIINAALFPVARRENAAAPSPNLPVPHFRSAAEARAHHATPTIIVPKRSSAGSLPLSAWLIAALISGIISYQLAPQAVASVAQAVRSIDSPDSR